MSTIVNLGEVHIKRRQLLSEPGRIKAVRAHKTYQEGLAREQVRRTTKMRTAIETLRDFAKDCDARAMCNDLLVLADAIMHHATDQWIDARSDCADCGADMTSLDPTRD